MKLRIKKLHPNARLPKYTTEGAACFDLYAATVSGFSQLGDLCYAGQPVIVGTGLAFQVPSGFMLSIRPRSGLAFKHGVQAFQGTIDSDYRGEVMILLECARNSETELPVKINPGDRVAQACLIEVPQVEFVEVEELTNTERGSNGFGSTDATS